MKIRELYMIVGDMVRRANEGNESRVLELNKMYETRLEGLCTSLEVLKKSLSEYERCRQSCVLAFSESEDVKRAHVEYAKARLAEINKSF